MKIKILNWLLLPKIELSKKIYGIDVGLNTNKTFKNTNLIIDFTIPKCTFEVLKIASKLKKE